ncbi:hypothetical protein BJ508DRAFT_361913 [Ascobolus immersus RN42]|uniref:Uncharacterized protein n=1 Tax=Ascobolus immersus RN42 TaxID=1160509 RepID=A0A3N4II52_ASCIM|nr:hypothetical protein BJ508DRAFT_361913 [Ascobolus immersus RN42]
MMFNAKALLGALLLAPFVLAETSIPTFTTTIKRRSTSPVPTPVPTPTSGFTTYIPQCRTADYLCPGCETTAFVTLSTPCSIPPGRTCPTDTFPPLTRSCPGCPTYSCAPNRPKTHWIQTCTYPTGCPEPAKTYRACPTPTNVYP